MKSEFQFKLVLLHKH